MTKFIEIDSVAIDQVKPTTTELAEEKEAQIAHLGKEIDRIGEIFPLVGSQVRLVLIDAVRSHLTDLKTLTSLHF